jgi:dTDP-4-dehydrorhamnose reductase
MRIVLFGKNGQLGWELQRCLGPLGQVVAWGHPQVDLAQPETLIPRLRETRPQVIVNAAAYTDVDRAEVELERAQAVNALAPRLLAEEASRLGAVLIHYSTDYVYDGSLSRAYTEADQPNPLNAYGRSKLAGDQAVAGVDGTYLILRTSWVYSLRRPSFVSRVLTWAREQPVLRVVSDQVGSPTWCRMLAEATGLLLAQGSRQTVGWLNERRGLYHLAGSGAANRYAWAQAVLEYDPHPEEQVASAVQPARTEEFPTPARRPLYTALDCARFAEVFGFQLPPWEQSLRLALENFVSTT